jgi:hypothetical protein
MSHYSDWLPTRRTEQLAMAKTWTSVLGKKGTAWGVQIEDRGELNDLWVAAEEALNKAMSSERTATITAQCKEAFDNLIAFMRIIKRRAFHTPPLLDSDYVSLELSPPDTIPTPIPLPTAQVEADLTFPGIHLLELRKIRPVAGNPPRSRSDYGVRIFWGLTGEPTEKDKFRVTETPKSGYDLPNSRFTRRQKELFNFDGESGNTVYFCMRYENPSGGEGPFGTILKAVIP